MPVTVAGLVCFYRCGSVASDVIKRHIKGFLGNFCESLYTFIIRFGGSGLSSQHQINPV